MSSLFSSLRLLAFVCLALLAGCTSESLQSLIASGKKQSANGDYKAAAIQFKVALQKDPRSAEARTLLGEALLESDDPAGAIVELNKALDDKAPLDSVLPSLSKALVLVGEYKRLVTAYGDLDLDSKPARAALKANVATAWGALGDRAKTEAAVAAALAAVPDYPPARILQARILAGSGQFEPAKLLVDKLLAADEKLYEAWLLRGELLLANGGDPKVAEDSFRKALAIDRAYIPAHSAIISSRIRARDIPGAKAQAAQLKAILPNHPLSLLIDGQLAYLDHDLPRAREIAQRLLRFTPDNVWVLMLAGAVEADLNSAVQAQAYFAKAVKLNPGLETARRNQAEAEIRLGQYANAMETLKPLLQANPPRVDALALAGDAELRQNNPGAAEEYFILAAKQDPSNERLQTAAALTRIRRGDPASGFTQLEALATKAKDTYVDQALFAARMKRGEYGAALKVLENLEKKDPGKASSFEMRGRVQMARRDLPAARAAFLQALKIDPALFSAYFSLASIDLLEGKPAQAIERMQAVLASDRRNPSALMALADIKSRSGAPFAESKALLVEAITSAPNSAAPRLQLIELLLRKRQFKDALAAARDAAAAMPGDTSILEAVGTAQMQAGDVEQAATTFRKLAAAMPKSARPYLKLADVYAAGGQRAQAETALNQALAVEPDDPAAQAALLDVLFSSNRQSNALEYIRKLKQGKPGQPVPYLLEATYHLRTKNTDAAAAAYREGIAKTGSSDLAVGLYKLLLQTGRQNDADQFGTSWMQKHPRDMLFEFQLATTNIARNELPAAEERLKRVVDAVPDQPLALNNLAWVMATRGKPGGAAYAQRAVDLMPDRPSVMDTLATALAVEKRLPEAIQVQQRALDLLPTDNALRLNLAKLALQAGDKALAKKELQRLHDAGPQFAGQAEVSELMKKL